MANVSTIVAKWWSYFTETYLQLCNLIIRRILLKFNVTNLIFTKLSSDFWFEYNILVYIYFFWYNIFFMLINNILTDFILYIYIHDFKLDGQGLLITAHIANISNKGLLRLTWTLFWTLADCSLLSCDNEAHKLSHLWCL